MGNLMRPNLVEIGNKLFGYTGTDDAITKLGINHNSVISIIGQVVAYLFGLLGVIFLVLAIYGGITWMTAAGNEEKATKGRTIITQAVVGLLVTLAVGSIYLFVRAVLGGLAPNA